MEMRMVLSMLYRNFEVERVGESADVVELFGFSMAPHGLTARFHLR